MTQKIRLMSHLVAGYPTDEIAYAVAEAMIKGGADILEIQLPFSDPSADGPAIQSASTDVLSRKYRTKDGLSFIAKIHASHPNTIIYIMSYSSLIYTPGIDSFAKKASEAGVKGMIIPDLPFDNDEGLSAACIKYGMENIPVAAPSMTDERLFTLAHKGFAHIYAALRSGITGSSTTINSDTMKFLEKAKAGGSKIYCGFGITNKEQSLALADCADAVVAGSVFVRIINKYIDDKNLLIEKIEEKARELTNNQA